MIKVERHIAAPYPVELLFNIAQDVENYQHFLPHCIAARILDKSPPTWRVENIYKWGPARYQFITHADIKPNKKIHIRSDPREHIQLDILWQFAPKAVDQTGIIFEMGFSSQIALLEKLVQGMLEKMAQETEHAFLKRAQSVLK